jgi:imidazolonepropionase-like amidohydrolase
MPPLTLYAKRIVDGSGAPPFEGELTIGNGCIERLTRHASDRHGRRADVIDLEGYTLLPGFVDAHSHVGILTFRPGDIRSVAETAAMIFRNCSQALDCGFTTLRDLAGVDGGVRRAIAAGTIRGPRILPSGPIICQTGGHGDRRLPFSSLTTEPTIRGLVQTDAPCDGVDGVRLATRRALADGAAQVKVAISGGVASYSDSIDSVQFSVPELQAAVEEAAAHGTYVTAHAHHHKSIMHGLNAGIRCFEHGSFLNDAVAQAMADLHASLIPTLTVFKLIEERSPDLAMPEEFCERAAGIREAMQQSILTALAHNVRVGLGTDLVGPVQTRRADELSLRSLVTSPTEAIRAATSVNAAILGIDSLTGALREGLAADVVAVSGDPFDEPELFQDSTRVALVIQDGQVRKLALPEEQGERLGARDADSREVLTTSPKVGD